MNLGVLGAGYVGLTTAICLASLNHTVTIFDISKERIQQIKNKKIPFYEEGLQGLLKKTISFNKLRITKCLDQLVKNTDGCFICVGTPNKNNSIDLSQIIESIRLIANSIKNNKKNNYVIIIRSTVIPTTTRYKIFPILKETLDEHGFGLCIVPEFLREGKALDDFMNPGKIIIGSIDEKSQLFVNNIFDNFKNKIKIINTNPETAELIKYASNSFFSLLISFANEIANISEKIRGVDSYEVLRALIQDKRITTTVNGKKIIPELTSYLLPGCGFGGSCLPKDVQALFQYSLLNRIKTPLLNAILEINDERPNKVISLAESILGTLKEKKISILGLTFKPDTDDMRTSPSISAIKIFQEKGARISAYDPMISKTNSQTKNFDFSLCTTLEDCLQNSELAILFTKWSEFSSIDGNLLKKYMKNPVIIDGRGFLEENNFEEDSYYKLGYIK